MRILCLSPCSRVWEIELTGFCSSDMFVKIKVVLWIHGHFAHIIFNFFSNSNVRLVLEHFTQIQLAWPKCDLSFVFSMGLLSFGSQRLQVLLSFIIVAMCYSFLSFEGLRLDFILTLFFCPSLLKYKFWGFYFRLSLYFLYGRIILSLIDCNDRGE